MARVPVRPRAQTSLSSPPPRREGDREGGGLASECLRVRGQDVPKQGVVTVLTHDIDIEL